MAEQALRRIHERNYVHCLRCHKPQDRLSVHLARVCMKNNMPEEIGVEVQKAKASSKKWIRCSRTWDYNDLVNDIPHRPSRVTLVRKLIQRGFFILNMPHESDMVLDSEPDTAANTSAATCTTSAAAGTTPTASDAPPTSPATSTPASVCPQGSPPTDTPSSSDEDDETRDPSWKIVLPTATTSVRSKMRDAGLYEKFHEDTVLLVDFKKYLSETLGFPNCRQEVENVSRFLRYLQPTGDELTMDFLSKSQETQEYISSLRRTEMTAATIIYYIKSMIRFLDYLKTRLDLTTTDKDLRDNLQAFKEFLQTMKKPVSKAHSRDAWKTRYNRLLEGTRSVKDCQEILRVAQADMLYTFGKLIKAIAVSETEKTTYRYYCEAVMVFKHFQRPGAVEGMTVTEWVNRKPSNGRVVIRVSQQVASFALNQEEEAWFQAYYRYIRPGYISSDSHTFFISSSGNSIHNVTNDIARFHEIYHIEPATSQEVRRAVETEAALLFTETQKENVRHYLAHTAAVTEQHDGMQVDESIVSAATLLDTLGGLSPTNQSPDSDQTPSEQANKPARMDFSAFVRTFPVTKDGQPPSKKARVEAGFPEDRVHYDKWRARQYAERQQYLLSHFNARKPVVRQVQRLVKKEGWTTNCPCAEDIVKLWIPASKFTIETDPKRAKKVTCNTHL